MLVTHVIGGGPQGIDQGVAGSQNFGLASGVGFKQRLALKAQLVKFFFQLFEKDGKKFFVALVFFGFRKTQPLGQELVVESAVFTIGGHLADLFGDP